jgi:hypothetical protein
MMFDLTNLPAAAVKQYTYRGDKHGFNGSKVHFTTPDNHGYEVEINAGTKGPTLFFRKVTLIEKH